MRAPKRIGTSKLEKRTSTFPSVDLQKGTELLINCAAGGIGMFAIQTARAKGAVITAVAMGDGIALLQDKYHL